MQSQVLSCWQHFEIFWRVVLFVVIFVMHMLVRPEGPTGRLFSKNSMFMTAKKLAIS
jgi:hypothetical protein